jgi:hypothetical protein
MKRQLIAYCAAAGLILTAAIAAGVNASFAPGSRIQMLAHNAYPDHGKYADRLDRAIAAGVPFVVEQDLSWIDGKSLMIHGTKNASGGEDPSLESYFFPKIRPIIEKALKAGNKSSWPIVTLYLDIKNDPPEHLEAISKVLDNYNGWLTTAVKSADIAKQSPLDLKPMMVLVEDKQDDIKQQFFYDRVPVGGKIRVFGTATKFDENPGKLPRERKDEAVALLADRDPEQLVSKKADNYRRWFGVNWAFIEKGGETKADEWSAAKADRLKKFVDYGHRLGYFVGFYCLNGYTASEDQGWDKDYNFGARETVELRWRAAIQAHADFISTDQYETLGNLIRGSH